MSAANPSSTPNPAPLAGLRIVELSSYVATPLCGMTLAQLGADVIRVEPLGGAADRTRLPLAPTGTSLYWTGLNKGKRAIAVNLSAPAGKDLVARLAAERGIVLTNSERVVSPADLRARRPDLIHVLLTGRQDGGSAVDYTVNAECGFPLATGPAGGDSPVNHLLPAWDVAAGLYLAVGLLSAVREHARTGRPQNVRVALEDVALGVTGNLGYLAQAQITGEAREPDGNFVYGTFGKDFLTADGIRVMVVALTPRHWRDLVAMTESAEVIKAIETSRSADFDDEGDRYRHRHLLAAVLGDWFATRPYAEVAAALSETRVVWSRFRTFTELASSGLLRDNPLFNELDQPGVGRHLAPGSPLVVGDNRAPAVPAPAVGEHTHELLREEIGLDERDIDRLVREGVIEPRGA
ncbi:dehydratase [Amycolatopsis deserti]|uniref:Dehydratase n=1 Tax=Amycolatopsis deserti TaxID=185696 RepID=A0ABQ3ITY0_9PSEU|nr:CoA transferase [Amycolatopsis deserti]GHE94024.1 dehydratase [Amycolatopsis deserti]